MTILNFIDGDNKEPSQKEFYDKKDPSTGLLHSKVAESSLLDVVAAIQAANKVLPKWTKTSPAERASFLNALAALVEENAQNFATAALRDIGTPEKQSLEISVPQAAALFRSHAKLCEELCAADASSATGLKTRSPIGLVAAITPASDPLVSFVSRFAPALAQANAVIWKPSRYTPETAHVFSRMIVASNIPQGVYAHVLGRGDEVGALLARHPAISTLAFMGSTETGQIVSTLAAENLKRVHLSLGAKNPVLVFADVDLDHVIPRVAALCLDEIPSRAFQASRVFIQESVYKDALKKLQEIFDRAEPRTLPHEKALARFREAAELAKKENGRTSSPADKAVVENNSGYQVKPVLVSDLTNCSILQQDEILGPLALVTSFKYQYEALKHANTSPYGRVGYVFVTDTEKARQVSTRLEVGRVFLKRTKPDCADFNEREIPILKKSGTQDEGLLALQVYFSRVSISR